MWVGEAVSVRVGVRISVSVFASTSFSAFQNFFCVDGMLCISYDLRMNNKYPTNESVRADVIAYLEESGMSVHALALRAQISQQSLRDFVEGKKGITLKTLEHLSRIIGPQNRKK